MTSLELFERLGLALAIGLLIGIERGWRERDAKPGSRAAGIRTFALIGLLGGVSAALAQFGPSLFLGLSILAFAAAFALFEWNEAKASNTSSATGMVAGLVTFALAALAVYGATAQAAAGAVAAALLLAERSALHTFVERLRWSELRAALILLAMTVILLPLLPDRTVDPWNALNPRELWAMTAAIAALSYAGYVCVRLMGERRGLLFGAAAAALVSSTAVTMNYSALPRTNGSRSAAISAGITMAWAVSLARMSALAIFVAPALVPVLLPPVAAAVALLLLAASLWYLRSRGDATDGDKLLSEPFDLGLVLRFGALLAVVVLVYKLASAQFGSMGLFPLAAASGVADVDPITLAVAKSAGVAVSFGNAAKLVLLAGTANFATRVVVLLSTRDLRFALPLISTGAAALALAWLTVLLLRI
jgi:uncharacterized membrane protein (DUF4010 family)